MSQSEKRKAMRMIILEEHYASPAFLEGPGQHLKGRTRLVEQLCELGEQRIADMDAAGVDLQVISLTTPGVEQLDTAEAVERARAENNHLADAIRHYPDRLAGFAVLPVQAPEIAADELTRVVREHGFKGAIINGHTRGRYLDDKFFWPILEQAQALQVPLYLHPTLPPQPVMQTYYGGFAPEVSARLAGGGWGWHIETAVHVLRLILGGAFDQYPDLQIIIGHMGETLPFMLSRFDPYLSPDVTKLKRPVSAYLRENIHYTFGGFNWTSPFLDLLFQVGIDRIMFSADYPYVSMEEACNFLEQLPLSPVDKERIAHGNAERLLRL